MVLRDGFSVVRLTDVGGGREQETAWAAAALERTGVVIGIACCLYSQSGITCDLRHFAV